MVICKICGRETFDFSLHCQHGCGPHGASIKNNEDGHKKTLKEYKKCPMPKCSHHNVAIDSFCMVCGAPLSKIYRVCEKCGQEFSGDECVCSREAVQHLKQNSGCRFCGSENSSEAEKCCKCGSSLKVTYEPLSHSSSPRIICQDDPHFVADIKDGDVIGREGRIDVSPLSRSNFISSRHATFFFKSGQWFLRAEKTTNQTKIGMSVLDEGQMRPLKDNDRIILADTIFIFRSA
jgi:ribosomal protein L40E